MRKKLAPARATNPVFFIGYPFPYFEAGNIANKHVETQTKRWAGWLVAQSFISTNKPYLT